MIPRPSSHRRSLSSGHRSLSPDRTVTKAKSTNDLAGGATDKSANVLSSSVGSFPESGFSTLKDPRLANDSEVSESSSPPSHHPDLNDEVAALSLKLVQAINNQTNLDDTLVATRQELEHAQSNIQTLELENEKYRRDIDQEVVVRKADVDREIQRLNAALAEEKAQRALVEKGKKTIEQELETLTAALFEEANKMVAAAKLEREAVEKKNEQLRSQVKDTELLLASHQDQLAELKAVMQGMNLAKDDAEARTTSSTAPSSPAGPQQLPGITKTIETPGVSEVTPSFPEDLVPGPSTSFPHLIKSVCRTDLQARAASGSYAGLNVMSLASLGGGGFGSSFGSTSSSPAKSQTHSPNGSMSSPQPSGPHIPLKETRFYKRAVVEDIEPTLRLDAAPGISWLTRRTVMSGICDGSLLVEPMPPSLKKYEFPCSLCGERRNSPESERTHRFRTSDSETAQRYPLCILCLEKVRSCCEFTGYLRLILDGHLRVGDTEEEKDAWEETVRLRERMFWSRIGAGVLPIFTQVNSPGGEQPNTTAERDDGHAQHQVQHDSIEAHVEQDDDDDDVSVYEDPFVSAGSESPASSAAESTPLDEIEPQNLDSAKDEVSEHTIFVTDTVTTTPVDDNAEPKAAPNAEESQVGQTAMQSTDVNHTVEDDNKPLHTQP
ncbi:rab guanine nucleotide exchange factor S2 [Aspergillus wentii]|nr:rab guanine nucleotide exchange factor S2 [Aspergillus wentii]